MQIRSERIEIPVAGGGSMGGYLARPDDAERRPAVVVFMEIFGINSHIREVVERVAREGYVALAPDFFHRSGAGVELGYDEAGFGKGMELLGRLRDDEAVADAKAALAALGARPDVDGRRMGAMGFCIGGHMTYLAACETDLRAAASFYGGGIAAAKGLGGGASTIGRTEKIGGEILCLFGERDAFIPLDQVDAIRSALESAGVDHQVVVYPGADHGFFCDQRGSYQKEAAEDAWRRVVQLFRQRLQG